MKLHLIVIAAAIISTGCLGTQPSTTVIQLNSLPPELKDCGFYRIDPGGMENIYTIVRCPNSQATVSNVVGKTRKVTTVIDGQEYQLVDKTLNDKK